MKMFRLIQGVAVFVACCGMLANPLLAAEPNPEFKSTRTVQDVELTEDGTFRGHVVDNSGNPLANCHVVVFHESTPVAQVKTDAAGRFEVNQLRSGVHHVAAGQQFAGFRFWSADTAPPSANDEVLMVAGDPAVRGALNGALFLLGTPGVLALLIAGGVGTAIALDNNDHEASS